ncbi:MAG: rhomboid family intramembrane serine protease [Chloroflexi bacterium]|nr:rhomboid family intramembrane serine protease [Chloroflexota bacterium]
MPAQRAPGTPATWTIAVVNVVVWLLLELNGGSQNVVVLLRFGAKYGPAIADGEYWRLLTAVFIHIGVFHLVANTIGLLIFGGMVERAYGMRAFIVIYVFAGVFGNVASYAAGPTVSAGASGAVFGIVGAFAAYLLANRQVLGDLARRSLWGVAMIVVINIVFGATVGGVDNWAHLGGLLSGGLLGFFLVPRLAWGFQQGSPGSGFEPAPLVGRPASLIRWQAVVILSALLLAGTTWIITRDYPYSPERIVATTASEAERSIQRGDFQTARDLVEALAAGSRGATRLGLFYLQRGLERAGEGDRRDAVTDIRNALRYPLPGDAIRIADAALAQLGERR